MADAQARREWREGWPLPLTSAIGYGAGVAQIYSFGLFIAPLQRQFGWSRTATSSGLTVLSAILLLAPLAGTLIDRWGPRTIAIPGMLFYCTALAALSLAGHALWTWWLLWVLVGLGTLAIQPTTWASAVVSRFDRTRGLALSVTLCGSGLGAAILPLVTNRLLLSFGWRGAYGALGGVLALVSVPLLVLFFRDAKDLQSKRAQPGAGPHLPVANGMTFAEALRSSRFWRLAIVSFLAVGAIVALLVHFVPILTWKGLARTKAAEIAGVIGIGSIRGTADYRRSARPHQRLNRRCGRLLPADPRSTYADPRGCEYSNNGGRRTAVRPHARLRDRRAWLSHLPAFWHA
jgi:MFS family permease